MKLSLCNNERVALPASLSLHIAIILVLSLVASRHIIQPMRPSGFAPITVHLMTLPPDEPPATPKTIAEVKLQKVEPVKQAAKIPLGQNSPIKKHIQETKPVERSEENKAVENQTQSSRPAHQWQEAKSDDSGPKILSQPMPKIPDDLRREAFNTYATAKFHVMADGSIEVELTAPSQNPRLNHIFLDSLKNWKFAPATKDGVPIDADFEIRVRFAVE